MVVPATEFKVFVGGISWETTNEILKEHFSKYGTVLQSVVAKDRFSSCPRGFAFVSFSEAAAVELTLQDHHEILGRTVDVKIAVMKSRKQQTENQHDGVLSRNSARNSLHSTIKKIFVGGLSSDLTEKEFRYYFERFGKIVDVVVMRDSVTHKPRGFGFITFDSESSVDEAVHQNFHQLNGKVVEVKRAIPKDGNVSNVGGYIGKINGVRSPYIYSYSQGTQNYRFQHSPSSFGGALQYPYGIGMFGGYPPGGYGGVGYEFSPVPLGNPWDHMMISGRGSMSPYEYGSHPFPLDFNLWYGLTSLPTNGNNGSSDHGFCGRSSNLVNQDAQSVEDSMPSGSFEDSVGEDSFNSISDCGDDGNKHSQNNSNQPYSAVDEQCRNMIDQSLSADKEQSHDNIND